MGPMGYLLLHQVDFPVQKHRRGLEGRSHHFHMVGLQKHEGRMIPSQVEMLTIKMRMQKPDIVLFFLRRRILG